METEIKKLLAIKGCKVEFKYRNLIHIGYLVNINNTTGGKVIYVSSCSNYRDDINTNCYFIDKIEYISQLKAVSHVTK